MCRPLCRKMCAGLSPFCIADSAKSSVSECYEYVLSRRIHRRTRKWKHKKENWAKYCGAEGMFDAKRRVKSCRRNSPSTQFIHQRIHYNSEKVRRQWRLSDLSAGTGSTNKTSSSQHAENSATAVLSNGQQSQQAMSLFTDAVIHGGQFSISINSLNQSPTLAVQEAKAESSPKRYKRLKVLDSDSDSLNYI